MNDFSVLLNDFFTKYLSRDRGLSENTAKNYRDTFIQFLQFMETNKRDFFLSCVNLRNGIE